MNGGFTNPRDTIAFSYDIVICLISEVAHHGIDAVKSQTRWRNPYWRLWSGWCGRYRSYKVSWALQRFKTSPPASSEGTILKECPEKELWMTNKIKAVLQIQLSFLGGGGGVPIQTKTATNFIIVLQVTRLELSVCLSLCVCVGVCKYRAFLKPLSHFL